MRELILAMSFHMAKHCREMNHRDSSHDLMDAATKCDYKECYFRRNGISCTEGYREENWKKILKKS